MYADIARPLYALLVVFEWTEKCEQSFEKLKQALISASILKAPDWNRIFHVHIDALAYALGCILTQPHEHNMDFPVTYASDGGKSQPSFSALIKVFVYILYRCLRNNADYM